MRALALIALLLMAMPVFGQSPAPSATSNPIRTFDFGSVQEHIRSPMPESLVMQPNNAASPGAPAASTTSDGYWGPQDSGMRFFVVVRNEDEREIRSVRWALVTRDSETTQEIGRVELETKKKIRHWQRTKLVASCKSSSGVRPWTRGTDSRIVVERVTFADGSVWDGR